MLVGLSVRLMKWVKMKCDHILMADMLLSLSGAALSDGCSSIDRITLVLNSSHLSSDPLNSAFLLTSMRDREMKTKKHR